MTHNDPHLVDGFCCCNCDDCHFRLTRLCVCLDCICIDSLDDKHFALEDVDDMRADRG